MIIHISYIMSCQFRITDYFISVKGEGPVLNEAPEGGKRYGGNGGEGCTRSYPNTRRT